MEEARGTRQWSSLIVPSVQEMAKDKNLTVIPPRYVMSDQRHHSADISLSSLQIPVIDMRRLCSASTSAMDAELQKLDFSCKEWGFFQLVNHGIEADFVERVKTEIQDFFNLPMEEKKRFWQLPNEMEGFGQAFVVSETQKLDWADIFYLTTQPPHLRKPHLFPNLPLPFRDTLETYSNEVKNIAKTLMAKMGNALKIEPEELEHMVGETMWQSMRMNYYPPCPQPDRAIGLTPHSDSVGLTILLQVNDVEGLQIKKDGKWVPVKPLPNAFVVNIGDIFEIVTNGTYRSIEHRAVVNAAKERLSVATFHNPGMDGMVGPARSLVDRQTKAYFKSVTTEDYFTGLFARELDGKRYLDALRL